MGWIWRLGKLLKHSATILDCILLYQKILMSSCTAVVKQLVSRFTYNVPYTDWKPLFSDIEEMEYKNIV
jgi:hypothetical protein